MDCLKSFNFTLGEQSNYTVANGFKYWPVGAQHFWFLEANTADSTINIQGFKNINIYKIEVTGTVNTAALPVGFSCLVQDWSFQLQVNGQNALIGNNIVLGGFNIAVQAVNPIFDLSKFQPSIEFPSPIQSATSITVTGFQAQGIANESILSAQIDTFVTFTVFYKFEGE
jgi:hypothetical protein